MRMKLSFAILIVGLAQLLHGQASPYVTLTGQIQGPNGLPAANANIELTPTQQFFVAGEGGNGYGVTSLTALSPIVATPSPIVDTGVLSYSTACGFEFWVWNGTAWACTTNVTATSTGLFLGNGATPGTLTFQGLDAEGTITFVNNSANRSSNAVIQVPNPLSGSGTLAINASSPLAIDLYGNLTCSSCVVSAVTSLTASLPIVVTPSPITGTGVISCPTCNATLGGTPSISVGAGAGSGATVNLNTGSLDGVGTVLLHTGSAPTSFGLLFTYTFSTPFATIFACTFAPDYGTISDVFYSGFGVQENLTISGNSALTFSAGATALTGNTYYAFDYVCKGY